MRIIATIYMACTLLAGLVTAEEYRSIAVRNLSYEPSEKKPNEYFNRSFDRWSQFGPEVRTPGEAYLWFNFVERNDRVDLGDARVVYKLEDGEKLKGIISLGSGFGHYLHDFQFSINPEKSEPSSKEEFLKAKREWANDRAHSNIPGTAWFKHIAGEQDEERVRRFSRELATSFQIFTGGRAVSENLALNRELILGISEEGDDQMVPLAKIDGVNVAPIDWSNRIPDVEIAVDPLAKFIPEDQHAIFAPSLIGFLDFIDQMEEHSGLLSQAISSRNPYRELADQYKRQLGLDFPAMTARLLPAKSIAITGGDPFFATGTDIAFLFESDNPDALYKALVAAIQLKTGIKGVTDGGWMDQNLSITTPDRSISSHVIKHGNLVAVTNSESQIRRLKEVLTGKTKALGSTDEFKFFRHRYPLNSGEDIFAFMSDATLRRWSGPEIRIGASRRNRALAALNELTSQGISGAKSKEDYSEFLGNVEIRDGMAYSEIYGSAKLLTPISELNIKEANVGEKRAYERWRRGYESGWSTFFDPIGLQVKSTDSSYDFDLTVLPLTAGTQYREFMDLVGNAKLSQQSKWRPNNSIMHFAMAIDKDSEFFKEIDEELTPMLPGLKVNPLSWVGDSLSISLEDSLLWGAIDKAEDFDFEMAWKIPLLVRVESSSRLKLGLFITGLRAMVDSSAPDSMKWQTRTYGDHKYVAIYGDEEEAMDSIKIYYATEPNALLVSLDEACLLNALDREKHKLSKEELSELSEAKSVVADLDPRALGIIDGLATDSRDTSRRQEQSWNAIPILNVWHRLFPDRDPVKVHEAYFGSHISCPGGKGYRWNEDALTMESVAYGYPGSSRNEGVTLKALDDFKRLETGIDFEDGGLRLRLHVGPAVETPEPRQPAVGDKLADVADLAAIKTGQILHYTGKDATGIYSYSTQYTKIDETPNGTKIDSIELTTSDDYSSKDTATYMLNDGFKALDWKAVYDDESFYNIEYKTGTVMIPSDLRQNAITFHKTLTDSKYDEEGETITESGEFHTQARVIGVKTIEVPAGKFEGCIGIEFREESISGEYFERTFYTSWYHPGTGLVKVENSDGSNDGMKLVKIEKVEE